MDINFTIKRKQFFTAQYMIVTSLLFLCFLTYIFSYVTGHGNVLGIIRLLDVGEESSIPTYFSTMNLFFSSLLAFIIYKCEKIMAQRGAFYWLILSILFLYLSVDEGARIHENFKYFQNYFGLFPQLFEHRPGHGWLPYGFILVLIVGFFFLPFLRSLPRRTALYFILSGLVFITGAIGFEFAGTLMVSTGFATTDDFIYDVRRLFEEGFEMYGIAIFNCTLFGEILKRKITLSLKSDLASR